MIELIIAELRLCLYSFGMGFLFLMIYDLLRLIRKWIKHSKGVVAVQDILFWSGCAIAFFRMVFQENNGELRSFSISALLLGMFFHYRVFANKTKYAKIITRK